MEEIKERTRAEELKQGEACFKKANVLFFNKNDIKAAILVFYRR